jgi:hypothetical protein
MALFKSVISDARPAKSTGRPAYAPPSLPGQPLHAQNRINKLNDSGPNASAELMPNPGTSDRFSPYGQSAPVNPGLSHYSGEQRETPGHGETDLSVNQQNESEISPLQSNSAAALIQHFGEQTEHRTPEIDRPIAEPAQESKQPDHDLPVFTLTGRDIENTAPAEIRHGDDQLPAPRGITQISDYENSTAHVTGSRVITNDTAAKTLQRNDNLDTAIQKTTRSVESANRADLFSEREKKFDAVEKLKPMESTIHRPFSDRDDGHNSTQAIPVGQRSATHYSALKSSAEMFESQASELRHQQGRQGDKLGQSSSPDNLWGKATQQQSRDSLPSEHQPTTARSSTSPESAIDAQLRKQSSVIQQQHQQQLSAIEKQARRVEARSTHLIQDQFAQHTASEHRSLRTPGLEVPRTAEVRIGQVDVFVERSSPAASRGNRAIRPSVSLASRHYLRRL